MRLREPLTTYFFQSVSATMCCSGKHIHAESEVMEAERSWQTFACASGRRRRDNCDIMPALRNVQFYTSVQQEALGKLSQPGSRRLSEPFANLCGEALMPGHQTPQPGSAKTDMLGEGTSDAGVYFKEKWLRVSSPEIQQFRKPFLFLNVVI